MKKCRQGRKTMGIPLTQGQVAIVDTADWWWLSEYKWFAQYDPKLNAYYAVRNVRLPTGKRTNVKMHREIMDAPKGVMVDHINHKTINNKRENLRLCTASQNQYNRGVQSSNTSGVKGVYWHTSASKWAAQITIKGKQYHLGCFDSLEEAAKVRRKAAKKFHKEFAHE